jgi:hypothetical protein
MKKYYQIQVTHPEIFDNIDQIHNLEIPHSFPGKIAGRLMCWGFNRMFKSAARKQDLAYLRDPANFVPKPIPEFTLMKVEEDSETLRRFLA